VKLCNLAAVAGNTSVTSVDLYGMNSIECEHTILKTPDKLFKQDGRYSCSKYSL